MPFGIERDDSDQPQVWEELDGKVADEYFSEGWGAVVAGRWLIGVVLVQTCVIGALGWKLGDVPRIDLSEIPIAVMRQDPNGKYIDTSIAHGQYVDRASLIPDRAWELIRRLREVTPDGHAMAANQDWVKRHLGDEPHAQISAYLKANPPEKLWLEDRVVRLPRVRDVLHYGGDTWTVLWTEELVRGGRVVNTAEGSANVTFYYSKPKDAETILWNPGGLYVSHLAWNQRPTERETQ
jgi:type IV secretory pathway TrbF-like protein